MTEEHDLKAQRAVVLLSGGQDSTTCLFWALRRFKQVEAFCFNYGQKHSTEIKAAQAIAKGAGLAFTVLDATFMANLTQNSLTNHRMPMDTMQVGATPPNTFVPGRNMFFITIAAVAARERGIFHIVTGVSQADYSGYPDCRDTFIHSLTTSLNLAMDAQFTIHTPLMWRDKCAVWALADELGVLELVKTQTVTCYNGIPAEGCGECPACRLRRRGLEEYLKSVECRV